MIKHWFFTGDIHGSIERMITLNNYLINRGLKPKECAVICLGDVGFNFYLNKKDITLKNLFVENCGYTIYCLKGNHEARPIDLPNINKIYDYEVNGSVYVEEEYPTIKYFCDTTGATYNINGYKFLTIGGAYSVDKYYRLEKGWTWFDNEQLTIAERELITQTCSGNNFDFILTHTCPISWQPIDLFINLPDSHPVDSTMEEWLENFKEKINYKVWLFGHYHDDRFINSKSEMLFTDLVPMEYFIDKYIKGEYNHI